MIISECRTGVELQEAMERVQERARELSVYLDKEVFSVLDGDVIGLGAGRTDGSSRAKIKDGQGFEELQSAALDKCLKKHRDQKSRMVVAR